MGMFDWVLIDPEIKLPGYPQGGVKTGFQTKDLDNLCDAICITDEGRLFRGTLDLNYHGLFNFYRDLDKVWYEYEAKFTDGNLVEIIEMEMEERCLSD